MNIIFIYVHNGTGAEYGATAQILGFYTKFYIHSLQKNSLLKNLQKHSPIVPNLLFISQ